MYKQKKASDLNMNRLNGTVKYTAPVTREKHGFVTKNKGASYPQAGGNSKLAFKGAGPATIQLLDKAAKWGASPVIAPLVSSAGILAVRPAITMMDKNTPKEDRIYSASWQAAVALSGLGVITLYNDKIKNLSDFLAGKIFGLNLGAKEKAIAEKAPHLAEAVYRNIHSSSGHSISKVLDLTDGQADNLVKKLEKNLAQKEKATLKGVFSSLNPLNLFRKNKEVINPFETSPNLIHEVRKNKDKVRHLMGSNAQNAKKILSKVGASKMVNFVLLMTTLTGATFLITKYLDPLMKFAGRVFDIKPLKNGVDNKKETDPKEEGKKKWSTFDKTVFAGLGALAVVEGVNLVGAALKKGNIAYEGIGKAFKAVDNKLNIGKTISNILKKPAEWIKNSSGFKKIKSTIKNQANVNDKWIERSVVFNLLARLGINVPTGQYYNATRDVVDQTMQLGLMGVANKTVINPARKSLAKVLGVPEYNEGVKVITDQVVKNLLIICTVMGFLNNAVSSRFVKFLEKLGFKKVEEKENEYRDFKKRFISTQKLDNFNIDAVTAGVKRFGSPDSLQSSNFAGNGEVVFINSINRLNKYKKEPQAL